LSPLNNCIQVIFKRGVKVFTAIFARDGQFSSRIDQSNPSLTIVTELLDRNREWLHVTLATVSNAAGLAIAFFMKEAALTYRYT
jgi:hypothetical protein